MIGRFEGDKGKPVLIETLRGQRIVQGDLTTATVLSEHVSLRQLQPNEVLIVEDQPDNDLFFILSGRVAVTVKGRQVAERKAGDHVGEMALIDPSARRSASVIAIEETVVATIKEPAFSEIGQTHSRLWRLLAVELCQRLCQRNRLVRPVNGCPLIFVGSSVESLPIAREIQDGLQHDSLTVRIWTDKVFGASRFPIEALEQVFLTADFGVLVIGPDDKVLSRKDTFDAPRDNVVFELGMCLGALRRERSFIVKPRGVDIKIPSDLLGMGCLEYPNIGVSSPDLTSAIGPVCNELRKAVAALGCR